MKAPLLEPPDLAEAGPPEAVRLPLDLIDVNPNNPRKSLTEIDALADNIRSFGLLQPVTVRRVDNRYELLGGHRRRAAFEHLAKTEPHEPRWKAIPAVITTEQDTDALLRMLISGQVHISAWSPKEEAAILEQLVQAGRTPTDVAQALNKSVAWASKRLRIYTDSVLSGYVQTGKLKPGVAEELLPVTDLGTKTRLAAAAAKEHLTQDQIKGRVRALRLDIQLRQIPKLTRQLLDLLSAVDTRDIPLEHSRELWTLHGRIEVISQVSKRSLPTIEEAQKAAGVKTQERPQKRGQRRKPGLKLRPELVNA